MAYSVSPLTFLAYGVIKDIQRIYNISCRVSLLLSHLGTFLLLLVHLGRLLMRDCPVLTLITSGNDDKSMDIWFTASI